MITSMAAAIVLMFTLNTGTLTTPTPELANKDGKGADAKQLVLTFPIAEEPEAPVAGNWDPYMLRYLVPHADVVLYGKVTKGDKKAEVKFTVHEVLRGKLATLKIDATQTRWRFGGCGPELARWPVGEFCCVYLNYDAKKKTYKFIESGVPIQTLPYKQTLGVDHLREIISVWDAEFAGKTEEQQKKHRETLKEREQLVFDLLTSNYKDHYAHIKKLKEMGGKKKAGKSKPVDADVVNEGKVK